MAFAGTTEQIICSLKPVDRAADVTRLRAPAPEALRVIRMITDGVGLQQNFEVQTADFNTTNTAFAQIKDGRRRIVYDAAEFTFREGRTRWRDIGVLAHEVGHHLAAHVYLSEISNHEQELEADYFSGAALSRLGAKLTQALAWTSLLSERGSRTHPPRSKRVKALEAGWRHGEAMKARERPACQKGWVSSELDIDGRQCRMARSCDGDGARTRLACEDYDGIWRWME